MSGNTSRRDFCRTAGLAPAIPIGISRAAAARPNVLIIHCHDLGRFLHCYGIPTLQTPNLDALASGGVRMARCFCSAPQCSPSRASIFTGRYPHNNGVMGLTHSDFAWDLNPNERHLGQILRDAGYRTAGVGIIHETRSGPERCGFSEYKENARAAAAADSAIGFFDGFARDRSRPFYLQVGTIEPHRLGHGFPEGYIGFVDAAFQPDSALGVTIPPYLRDTPAARTELAELQGAVHHADQHIGRILAAVREKGLEENTLVFFTVDHGIALPRAKCSLYEPGLEVACILRLPSRKGWHGGRVVNEMISNVDFVPTILELLDVPAPAGVQGRSFAPLLDGRSYQPHTEIFGELSYHSYYDPCRSVRTEKHKLIVNFSSAPSFMDPSQSWRPRCDTVQPPYPATEFHRVMELYDLSNDPWERRNLAADKASADIRKDLLRRLSQHLTQTEDPILRGAITPPLHRRALEAISEV